MISQSKAVTLLNAVVDRKASLLALQNVRVADGWATAARFADEKIWLSINVGVSGNGYCAMDLLRKSKDFAACIDVVDTSEFPAIPADDSDTGGVVVAPAAIDAAFRAVKYAHKDTACGALSCVALDAAKNAVVATDGRQLYLYDGDAEGVKIVDTDTPPATPYLLPAKAVNILAKLLAVQGYRVRIDGDYLRVDGDGVLFVAKLGEGKYPDYALCIPRDNPFVRQITAPEITHFKAAVDAVAPFADSKHGKITIDARAGVVDVRNRDIGKHCRVKTPMPIHIAAPLVGFDCRLLSPMIADIIRCIDTDNGDIVTITTSTQISASLWTTGAHAWLLMPVRIYGEDAGAWPETPETEEQARARGVQYLNVGLMPTLSPELPLSSETIDTIKHRELLSAQRTVSDAEKAVCEGRETLANWIDRKGGDDEYDEYADEQIEHWTSQVAQADAALAAAEKLLGQIPAYLFAEPEPVAETPEPEPEPTTAPVPVVIPPPTPSPEIDAYTVPMPAGQEHVVMMGLRGEEKEYFHAKVTELKTTWRTMPRLREQDGKGDAAIAYLHYFYGGSDWWITERGESLDDNAFGFVCLNGEIEFAELGYISLADIATHGAELDFHFAPTTIRAIKAGLGITPPEPPATTTEPEPTPPTPPVDDTPPPNPEPEPDDALITSLKKDIAELMETVNVLKAKVAYLEDAAIMAAGDDRY
jgi:hypothetical protein